MTMALCVLRLQQQWTERTQQRQQTGQGQRQPVVLYNIGGQQSLVQLSALQSRHHLRLQQGRRGAGQEVRIGKAHVMHNALQKLHRRQ